LILILDLFFDFVSDSSRRFRWVALQLNSLSTCHSMWTLRKAINALPPGLDDTYSRILEKVNEHEKPTVRLMLQWLCFSFRPLRIEELTHIYHIGDAIEPPFNLDSIVFNPEDILDVSPGLFSLTTTSVAMPFSDVWYSFPSGATLQILQLAHFSVKEYLVSRRAGYWFLDQERAHISI
jgi:hypothetical protein